MLRPALTSTLVAALLLLPTLAGATAPPVFLPPDAAERVSAALASIAEEIPALRAAHPDAVGEIDETPWGMGPGESMLAFTLAARTLADTRHRVALGIPAQAGTLSWSRSEAVEAVTALVDEHADWAAGARAALEATPQPGFVPLLLEQAHLAWPVYEASSHLDFVRNRLQHAAFVDWTDPGAVLGVVRDLGTARALHDHLSPRAGPQPAPHLDLDFVREVQSRAAHGTLVLDRDVGIPKRLADEALQTGELFSALMYTLVAERAYATSRYSDPGRAAADDPIARVAQMTGPAPDDPHYYLAMAWQMKHMLDAHADTLPERTREVVAADILAWIHVDTLVRGEVADPPAPTSLPGPPSALAALALLILASQLRRASKTVPIDLSVQGF